MVYLLDPLIATGGTAVAAVHMITDWGIPGLYHPLPLYPPNHIADFTFSVTKIKLLSILASDIGLKHVQKEFPGLEVLLRFRCHHLLQTLIQGTSM